MVTGVEIRRYERVNDALAESMFGEQVAGKPVYVLPELDELKACLEHVGVDSDDPGNALAQVVRGTLFLEPEDEGTAPFNWHVARTRKHERSPEVTPPSLALLTVLSLAADAMHAGEG